MKKTSIMVLILLIGLMPFNAIAYADKEDKLGQIDIQYGTQSYQYIMSARSSISDMEDGDIYITASTRTNSAVDYLGIDVTLQRWNGYSWNTIKTWSTPALYNNDYIYFEAAYKGTIGDKYRVKAVHTVKENGLLEIENTLSSSITLN